MNSPIREHKVCILPAMYMQCMGVWGIIIANVINFTNSENNKSCKYGFFMIDPALGIFLTGQENNPIFNVYIQCIHIGGSDTSSLHNCNSSLFKNQRPSRIFQNYYDEESIITMSFRNLITDQSTITIIDVSP